MASMISSSKEDYEWISSEGERSSGK